MSYPLGAIRHTTAGADLSTTGQYLFIYLDSADSYKAKLRTDPHVVTRGGVLQNAPADDANAEFIAHGIAKVKAGGAINPYEYVTVNSSSEAVAAITGDVVFGQYVPDNTAAGVLEASADGDIIDVDLLPNPYVMKGEKGQSGSVVGYYAFGTDGGAVSAITLRDANGNDVVIPTGATVLGSSYYRATTTFTSSGDGATIALSIGGLTLKAATAISTGTTWDASINIAIAAGLDITTSAAALTATIAVEAVTAGELLVQIDYIKTTEGS